MHNKATATLQTLCEICFGRCLAVAELVQEHWDCRSSLRSPWLLQQATSRAGFEEFPIYLLDRCKSKRIGAYRDGNLRAAANWAIREVGSPMTA
jgi:hypothetical protein